MAVSADVVAAFCAGVASILGASFSIKRARKQEQEACDVRVNEVKESYDRGLAEGLHLKERADE